MQQIFSDTIGGLFFLFVGLDCKKSDYNDIGHYSLIFVVLVHFSFLTWTTLELGNNSKF